MPSITNAGTLNAGAGGPPPRPNQFSSTGTAGYDYATFTLLGNGTYTSASGSPTFDALDMGLSGDITHSKEILHISAAVSNTSGSYVSTTTLQISPGIGGAQHVSGPLSFTQTLANQAPTVGTVMSNLIQMTGYFRRYYVFESLIASGQQQILGYLELHHPAGVTIWNLINPTTMGIPSGLAASIDIGACDFSCMLTSLTEPYESLVLDPIPGGTVSIIGGGGSGFSSLFAISGENDQSGIHANALMIAIDGGGVDNYANPPGPNVGYLPSFVPGGSWAATVPASMYFGAAGSTHTLQVFDQVWGICSNVVTFTLTGVAPTQQITLNSISATAGLPYSVGGFDIETPNATAMDSNLDNTGWLTAGVQSFSPATVSGGHWGGIEAPVGAGVHTQQVRNASSHLVVSNIVTFVVSGGPPPVSESITLTSVVGTHGTALGMTGVTNNGPPSAMDYSLDGGNTWAPCASYSSATGTLNASFSASGTVLP